MKNIKKSKLILAICLVIHSVSFFVLFLLYWNKKRSLAKTFAAISAAGGIAGALLIYKDRKNLKKEMTELGEELAEEEEDFFGSGFDEDEVFCDFEKEDGETEESEIVPDAE